MGLGENDQTKLWEAINWRVRPRASQVQYIASQMGKSSKIILRIPSPSLDIKYFHVSNVHKDVNYICRR